MPGIVDGLTAAEGAAVGADDPAVLPKLDPLGIGADLDRPPDGGCRDRVLVAVDAFYVKKKDFVGPLSVESPLVFLGSLGNDLGLALGTAFAVGGDATIDALLGQLSGFGLSSEQVAGIIAGLVQGGIGSNPAAIVQPDQQVLPDGAVNEVGGFLAYLVTRLTVMEGRVTSLEKKLQKGLASEPITDQKPVQKAPEKSPPGRPTEKLADLKSLWCPSS